MATKTKKKSSKSTSAGQPPKTEGQDSTVSSNFKNVIPGKKKILKQYLDEKLYAIKVRQVKINNWIKNEELYNGVTQRTLLTRSNLNVPYVFQVVHDCSAKIGQTPEFDFHTIPEGDENAADIMRHIVRDDMDACNWEITYEGSKIECGIYGRTIYEFKPGNDKQSVDLVDTLAFLISPIAKDTRGALYSGRQFIYKTLTQLEDEIDEMEYDTGEIQKIKDNKVPNEAQQDTSSEASLRNIRLANMGLANVTQYGSKVVELTSWWTYLAPQGDDEEGDESAKAELYNIVVGNDQYLLRCVKASDLGLDRPPFVSWGTYPRGITFWCPSVADVCRDPNLAMNVTLNQVVDNNTYRNFGMMMVSSASGLKQSSISPRPLGLTVVNLPPDGKIQDHVWQHTPPEISTGLQTMATIKSLADAATGLAVQPPSTKGGKMSVTQQAKAAAVVDQNVKVMKSQATLAFQELVQMWSDSVMRNMTTPRQVKVFGYKQLTIEGVTKDNFKDVKLVAKATPSENSQENAAQEQKGMLDVYTLFKDDPKVPGQTALRRSLVKKFKVKPEEAESWFSGDKKDAGPGGPAGPDGQPQDPNAQQDPNGPQPDGKIVTPETPLLSETAKNAAAAVPREVKA